MATSTNASKNAHKTTLEFVFSFTAKQKKVGGINKVLVQFNSSECKIYVIRGNFVKTKERTCLSTRV